jgi:hypothetical protein
MRNAHRWIGVNQPGSAPRFGPYDPSARGEPEPGNVVATSGRDPASAVVTAR